MALKKSELYSSLWASCDELRGGMDASQYKDYVLVLLFIKYVSDKYAGIQFAPVSIPQGSSFQDMVALKGKSDIGDQINKKIIAPLAKANNLSDFPDFNEASKLGSGKEMVDRLTNLIGIFENPALDFSKNRADGDDILGDAYEYLMRHFATESGKSKGQFYTPAEVSRIMAQILGIRTARTTSETTVYDPTCGSGSLLLKVADEATTKPTLYGQEKDAATSALARMNMYLHNNPTALILPGNTLADPKFTEGGTLKTFDYVVANPPFSDKRWSTGVNLENDPYDRFKPFGTPPGKQGDYAYLLHIVRSLKSTGKGACILPHGVLFRGNAEADIRRNLVRKGYIKAIIGLPANLFYGTGIPACIVVIDKHDAHTRKGIFLIDASAGYKKDGPKNRLRAQDIHKIVDVFNRRAEVPKFSRMVSVEEIEKNDFNLNLPRYIDSQQEEDLQDIEGHLRGGIPERDVDALNRYWTVCPCLRKALFQRNRPGYVDLRVEKHAIKSTIYDHPEFTAFIGQMNAHFAAWRSKSERKLKALEVKCHPKQVIAELAEGLLHHYEGQPLIDAYDVYQHLLDFWDETMQDDCYLIAADGWKAETYRVIERKKGKDGKPGKQVDKGWACDLVPKELLVARYYASEQKEIEQLMARVESIDATLEELEQEQIGDEDAFADSRTESEEGKEGKVTRATVMARLKAIKNTKDDKEETALLSRWIKLDDEQSTTRKNLKEAETALDAACYARYPKLTDVEIKTLVVEDKWIAALDEAMHGEMNRISQTLTQRVKDLGRSIHNLPTTDDQRRARTGSESESPSRKNGIRVELMAAWKTDRLGGIVTLQRGFDLPHRFRRLGPFPIVTSSGIDAWHNEAKVQGPGVVTGRYGTIGKVYFIDGPFWPLNTTLYVRDFNGNDPLFVAYLLRTVNFDVHSGKTGVPGVNRNDLHQITVSVPPTRSEQEAIAAALSDADALIESLEQLLGKKRQIKQGAMQELLTGKKRLPGFAGKWETKRLGDVADTDPENLGSETIPTYSFNYISLEDVDTGTLRDSSEEVFQSAPSRARRKLRKDDVLVSTVRPNLQSHFLFPFEDGNWICSTGFCVIRCRSGLTEPRYVYFNMFSEGVTRQIEALLTGSNYPAINSGDVRALHIPLPPYREQAAIADILSDMDAEIATLEGKVSKAHQIKQGMMQELLTGRIRLVRPSAQILSFPVKETASVAKVSHNTQINEAVVIAVLSATFGSEKFPLGRFRRTKLSYLLHRHVEHEAAGFMKKAAGPYNPRTRYGGAEKIALQNRYVRVLSTGKSEGFVSDENIAQAEGYFEKWYGAEALTWLEQFRYQKNDALELLTTVDMACQDLSQAGKAATLSAVKQIIHDSPEWKAKLNRAVFSDDNIATTIQSCGQLFPIEKE